MVDALVPPVPALDTLPDVLTLAEVAAVFRRKPGGVKKAVYDRNFKHIPAPFTSHPMMWRKSDVQRFLNRQRPVSQTRRAA